MPATLRDTSFPAGLNQNTGTSTLSYTGISVVPGSLLIIALASERGALADLKTPSCPDGTMTEIGSGVSGSSGLFLRVYQRVITTTTSTTMTVTAQNSTAGTPQKTTYGGAFVFDDHDGIGDFAFATAQPSASVTPANADDWFLLMAAYEDPGNTTVPSGMTQRGSSIDPANLGEFTAFTQQLSSTAATGTKTYRSTGSTVSLSLIIKSAQPVAATGGAFFPFFGAM